MSVEVKSLGQEIIIFTSDWTLRVPILTAAAIAREIERELGDRLQRAIDRKKRASQ